LTVEYKFDCTVMIFYLTSDMLPVAPPIVRPSDTVEANSITPPSVSLKSK